MKSGFARMDGRRSDQSQGVPHPPIQKPCDEASAETVELPPPAEAPLRQCDVLSCIRQRRSRREFSDEPLALSELSLLLWATQGVDRVLGQGRATLRPVPSAGARHPFETYLIVQRVEGLKAGVYRYLPLEHELLWLFQQKGLRTRASSAALGQRMVGQAAAVFVWSCIPYRGEWRYQHEAHKAMLLDAGHVGQNLYLAAEAIGAATCAVGAYDQDAMDALLQLDSEDEFVVYLAPVGRRP